MQTRTLSRQGLKLLPSVRLDGNFLADVPGDEREGIAAIQRAHD